MLKPGRSLLRTLVAAGRRGDAAVVGAFRRGLDLSQEPFSGSRLTDGDEDEQDEQGEQDEMTDTAML